MPDQPTALERTAGFASLLVELCRAVLDRPQRTWEPAARGLYQQNRWAAARFGLAAELFHPDGKHTAKAGELAEELAGERMDVSTTEADRQLEVGRSRGLEAVCADLVERTLG
jgi:gamma-glutamyl:cysteine ligase YbdK (ATP-grasp superfamily)